MVDRRQRDMLVHGDVEDPTDRYGDHTATPIVLTTRAATSTARAGQYYIQFEGEERPVDVFPYSQ